ncbi:TPA: hypothetical protein JBD64_15395 [Legionella pneumophila subsp. pneumophila]|nr:hypothetical protein [Legionella pneumophila subsp. pneumophila]
MAATETTVTNIITGENPANKSLQQMAFGVLLNNMGLFNNDDVANLYPLKMNLTDTLIEHVAHGRQDEAKAILVKFPELLLETGTAIDIAGNQFTGTAFQYAVWAMDTYMYTMMLDCLPQNDQGEAIRKGLLEQAKAQKEHFDFQPLITALKTYVDSFDAWDWPQREEHWCKAVGGAQRRLPAHVRHEYCNPDRPFYPVPSFTEKVLTRSLRFYNWGASAWQNWSADVLGLGSDFAILSAAARSKALSECYRRPAGFDLAAITALCKVRLADVTSLKQRLQIPIQKPDNVQDAAGPMIP